MIKYFIFLGAVFLISFSLMVITIETTLYLFRNSMSFNTQQVFRRSVPFFSLLTVTCASILRTTTHIYTPIVTPYAKTISSNSIEARTDVIRLCMIAYLIITAVLILQYAMMYVICVISIKKSPEITYKFNYALGKRRIKVYSWENTKTPFCFGTLSKCIVFPSNYSSGLDYAIQHEISHCDNYDSITNNIARIMLLLMWFNPFAYLYYQQVKIGCEYACDERVTQDFSFREKKEYIEVILASTQRKHFIITGAALSTEKTLKSRFKNVLSNPPSNNKHSIVISFNVVLALMVVLTIATASKIPEQLNKSVKINYSSAQEVNKEVYYEEYIDGKWFRGDLQFDSIEDLDYGIKRASYVGTLYEGE